MHGEPCSNASQFGAQSDTEVVTDSESADDGSSKIVCCSIAVKKDLWVREHLLFYDNITHGCCVSIQEACQTHRGRTVTGQPRDKPLVKKAAGNTLLCCKSMLHSLDNPLYVADPCSDAENCVPTHNVQRNLVDTTLLRGLGYSCSRQ